MPHPNVVEYARHFNLTIDHRAYLQQQFTTALEHYAMYATNAIAKLLPDEDKFTLLATLLTGDDFLTEEMPCLTSEQSQILLSATTQPPVSLEVDNCNAWNMLLPSHKQFRRLKLEEPLLIAGSGAIRSDVRCVKRAVSASYILQKWQGKWENENASLLKRQSLEMKAWLHDTERVAAAVKGETSHEKMQVSIECMTKLREAVRDPHDSESMDRIVQQNFQSVYKRHTKMPTLTLNHEDFAESDYSSCEDDSIERGPCSSIDSNPNTTKNEIRAFVSCAQHDSGIGSIEAFVLGIGAGADRLMDARSSPVRPNSSRKRKALDDEAPNKRRKAAADPKLVRPRSDPKFQAPIPIPEIELSPDKGLLSTQNSDSVLDAELLQLSAQVEQQPDYNLASRAARQVPFNKIDTDKISQSIQFSTPNFQEQLDLGKILEDELDRIHLSDDWRHETAFRSACTAFEDDDILQEQLYDDCSGMIRMLSQPLNVVTSDKLLWKPSSLRLLDENDSDNEDIVIADMDDECLVRSSGTASVELNVQSKGSVMNKIAPSCTELGSQVHELQVGSPEETMEAAPKLSKHTTSIDKTSSFSAAASLSAFLDLRGKRFKTATVKFRQSQLESPDDPIQLTQKSGSAEHCNDSRHGSSAKESATNNPDMQAITLPLPTDSPLGWPKAIVLNNNMLQTHAGLVRFLESHEGPPVKIMYRDFSMVDGEVPDVILGPTSCLILTSLQALTQRSLPGHKSSVSASAIRERIVKLSQKYKFVAILVSCSIVSLAESHSTASVAAFCTSISRSSSHRVQPIYIPHRTSEELRNGFNAWAWALVLEHGFPTSHIRSRDPRVTAATIFEEETPEEVSFRRMGENALSARVILGMRNLACRGQ